MIKCEICGKSPSDGTALFRVNKTGIKGVWRCREHLTNKQLSDIDPETARIVSIIEGKPTK
jgi:hypothetical protein